MEKDCFSDEKLEAWFLKYLSEACSFTISYDLDLVFPASGASAFQCGTLFLLSDLPRTGSLHMQFLTFKRLHSPSKIPQRPACEGTLTLNVHI